MNTYTYDSANRLISIENQLSTIQYRYNGLGDRLQETVDGVTTTFVMDLAVGLTQALSDGTYDYIYGNGRIAQVDTSTLATDYFLGDALGSVRQLTDSTGAVTFAQGYAPFGTVATTSGSGATSYGFTNEYQSQGKIYLRARHYMPYLNQFIQPDTIVPDPRIPADWNKYTYVRNNPVNYTDPSGKTLVKPFSQSDLNECVSSQQLQEVDISVKYDVCKMIPELEVAGFYEDMPDEDHISGGYRDPRIAHKVSTAYHIIHNLISIDDLENTPRDLDGTTWYKDEWKYLFPDCENKNIAIDWLRDLRIKQNAAAQIPTEYYDSNFYVWYGIFRIKSSPYALEGYAPGDPHRLPNSDNPPISKHVLRIAVDIRFGVINPDLMWDDEVNKIATSFNLSRPYHDIRIEYANTKINEWWHFERP